MPVDGQGPCCAAGERLSTLPADDCDVQFAVANDRHAEVALEEPQVTLPVEDDRASTAPARTGRTRSTPRVILITLNNALLCAI